MKNNTTKKNASRYLKAIFKLLARTTAFGIVGFIHYRNESTDIASILYDLTEKANKRAV